MPAHPADEPVLEITHGSPAFGGLLHRLLPQAQRRLVGAWSFIDAGSRVNLGGEGFAVGPHPHIGLQTCTWFIEGGGMHRDSLGRSHQAGSGEMMLMTAGRGITHAERSGEGVITFHGCQLWIALPDSHRNMEPRFDPFTELPRARVGGLDTTVFVGSCGELTSPAPTYSPLIGADVRVAEAGGTLPLDPSFEHCLFVMDGRVAVEGRELALGELAYLGRKRSSLTLEGPGHAIVLGGEPLGEDVLLWWNFIARTWDEMAEARSQWIAHDPRFPEVIDTWDDAPRLSCPDLPEPTPG